MESHRQESSMAEFIFTQMLALFKLGKNRKEPTKEPHDQCVFTWTESQCQCLSIQCRSCESNFESQESKQSNSIAKTATKNNRELHFDQVSDESESRDIEIESKPKFQRRDRENFYSEYCEAIAAALIRKYKRIEINRESHKRGNFIEVQHGPVPICVN